MKRLLAVLLAATAILSSGSAFALTQTNSMNVSMPVYTPTSCTVSAGGTMDFGTYLTNTSNDLAASTTVSVACTSNRSYNIYPDDGLSFSGTRRMKLTTATTYIAYTIYQDAMHGTPWGASNRLYGSGSGVSQSLTVYGVLPFGQLPTDSTADGVFNDTITMVVEYIP